MGCRKYKGEAYFDDLTGQTHLPEDLEEMPFVFDGEAYVIDLTDENAAAFRAAMMPFVRAARRTTKSKILASLPKRKRHLKAVPSPSPQESETEPEKTAQNGTVSQKGQEVEARSGAEGSPAAEAPSGPLDSSGAELSPRPALSLAAPPEWAAFAPHRSDDAGDRRLKARQWAAALGMDLPGNMVTPQILEQWEVFYRQGRWINIQ